MAQSLALIRINKNVLRSCLHNEAKHVAVFVLQYMLVRKAEVDDGFS